MSFSKKNEHLVNDEIDSASRKLTPSDQNHAMKEAERIAAEYKAHLKDDALDEKVLYGDNGLYA